MAQKGISLHRVEIGIGHRQQHVVPGNSLSPTFLDLLSLLVDLKLSYTISNTRDFVQLILIS